MIRERNIDWLPLAHALTGTEPATKACGLTRNQICNLSAYVMTLQSTEPHQPEKQLYLIHRNKHRLAAGMRRQRNMLKMKEQNKTPGKELDKMKTSNLLDAEFKILVIRTLDELRGRINELSESFNDDIRIIKNRTRKRKRTSKK